MHLHRSNRSEALLDRLVELVQCPLGDALARECIVVQGRGMERWLSMELARRLEVWANPWFPFPRRVLEIAFAAAEEPAAAVPAGFEPGRLEFAVAAALESLLGRPGFEPLARYVAAGERSHRLVEVAVRIAEAFDRYVVYRPDLIRAWDAGREDGWESQLWRALCDRIGREHAVARGDRFLAAAAGGKLRRGDLPERLSLFGISMLPPYYVDLFSALASVIEVHLFMLSPSREFWADVRSRRELLRERRRRDDGEDVGLHFAVGNPLLADNGSLARDFQSVVEQRATYEEDSRDLYVDPGTGSLLAVLQSDVLTLRQRGAGSADEPPWSGPPGDRSIEIHSCHSPIREVEVLRDRLLALFADPELALEPRDVVVMTPSIERYAPFVEAAFGGGPGEPRIPFRVTDRTLRATDGSVAAFLRLLEVLESRFAAPEVVDLLELAPIRDRFAIDAAEIEGIRRWVARSGIRWGVDARHRAESGQPADEHHTWRFGLDRLFLGYALAGESEGRLFAGRLPYDEIEGTSAESLGRLADFVATLVRFRADLRRARPIADWAERLLQLVLATIATSGTAADELARLRTALQTLGVAARDGGFALPVELRTVRERLAATLDLDLPSTGFLAGGVTVCAMMPMRSIPFRVVCLLGMSDRDFPRAPRLLAFDRMALRPRLGDRSPRDDDRFLFLEALLAARERLLVTYVGQSVHDATELPPSVVVSELLEVVAETSRDASVVFTHPLQAFDPVYFDERSRAPDATLFSYSPVACGGARALAAGPGRGEERPFVSGPLSGDRIRIETVTLEELISFFKNPDRAFVRRRLALDLGADTERLESREPFVLDSLEDWHVGEAIVTRLSAGQDEQTAISVLRAAGQLPPGVLGALAAEKCIAPARAIAAALKGLRQGAAVEPLAIEGTLGPLVLSGQIGDLWPGGQVIGTYSALRGKRLIEAWLRHLFLCWRPSANVALRTTIVGRSEEAAEMRALRTVENAGSVLAPLVEHFRQGAERPLPFSADVSWTYWITRQGGDDDAARRAALEAWIGTQNNPRRDPYRERLREGGEADVVASAEFAALATEVFAPLAAHLEGEVTS